MSFLVKLYPPAWRERYEVEFLSLIADRPPRFLERFDIVRGALDARLHPQVRTGIDAAPPSPVVDSDLRVARRLGIAAAFGALVWPAAFGVMLAGPIRYDEAGAYRDGTAAIPIFLLAIVLLVAGLVGQLIRLPADARLARAGAIAAIPFLLLFSIGPWLWPIGLTAFGLLAVLAIGGLRSGAWPRGASIAVLVPCLSVAAIVGVAAPIIGDDRMLGGAFFLAAALILVPVWLAVAAPLIRLANPPTSAH